MNDLASEHIIKRQNKLDTVFKRIDKASSIVITAKAGQGKTIFAEQIAEEFFDQHIIYQLTEQDKDPLFSIYKLFYCSMKNIL
ncbi:MAG: hypothetical protein C0602_06120 [Denitrovibrio sp.]|nr:MAG: hypothetical protein C0602_06120 [Denitrovibrio sp.]